MDIANIQSQTAAAYSQAETRGKSSLGQQEFLQLLVAQMRNQDPINPLDGTEFASQLAQFNSVEQLINVNNSLSILQESQDMMSASLSNSMASSLAGKEIRAISDRVKLEAAESPDIHFKLNNEATEVEIVIRNAVGSEVRRETLEGLTSGEHSWQWDGKNNAGHRLADGNYVVEILASNGDSDVGAITFIDGVASKVRYTADGIKLSVNGIDIPIGDVEEVGPIAKEN